MTTLSCALPHVIQPPQRRADPRFPCALPVAIFAHGQTYRGTCINLSKKGLRVVFEQAPPQQSKFSLVLYHDERYLFCDALCKTPAVGENRTLGFGVVGANAGFDALYRKTAAVAAAQACDPSQTDLSQPPSSLRVTHVWRQPDPAGALPVSAPLAAAPGEVRGRIGRFAVIETLGRGFFGTTYRVEEDGRSPALKVFHGRTFADEAARRRMLAYLSKLAEVQHDHLLPILEVGILAENNTLYMVTPYCRAGSLAALVEAKTARGESIHVEHVARWAAELAAALEHFHHKRLVHTNLKPANILFSDEGRLLLADPLPPHSLLGAAQRAAFQAQAPPQFVAPALCAQMGSAAPRRLPNHDLYGLGALLEYALSGGLHGQRSPVNRRFSENDERHRMIGAFFQGARRAPAADPLRVGYLSQALARIFPDAMAAPAVSPATLNRVFGDKLAVYRSAARELLNRDAAGEREQRTLQRLRVGIGLSRDEAAAIDAEWLESEASARVDPPASVASRKWRAPSGGFWLWDALKHPLSGLTTLLIWGVLIPVFMFVVALLSILPPLLVFGLLAMICVTGFFFQTSREVVQHAAAGERAFCDFPQWNGVMDSGLVPYFQWFVVHLMVGVPAFLLMLPALFQPSVSDMAAYLQSQETAIALVSLLSWPALPWLLLMVSLYGVKGVFDVVTLVRVLPRLAVDYMVSIAVFGLLFVCLGVAVGVASVVLSPLPALLVGWVGYLYLWFAGMRALGLFYWRNEDVFFEHGSF